MRVEWQRVNSVLPLDKLGTIRLHLATGHEQAKARRMADRRFDDFALCAARKIGEINGTRTRTAAFTEPNADSLQHDLHVDPPVGAAPTSSPLQEERISFSATEELNWRSREDLHLELPPSQSGVHGSYTSGATKMVRHAGAAPALSAWKAEVLACYTNDAMKNQS